MDRYQPALLGYLVTIVKDRDSALDCLQDTFMRAYTHLLEGRTLNGRWLYSVARNRAMDDIRKCTRERHEPEEAALATAGVVEEPEAAAARRALDCLSVSDREILYLFTVDRMSTAEIAAMLGIRRSALRVRLSRARERFRLAYGDPA